MILRRLAAAARRLAVAARDLFAAESCLFWVGRGGAGTAWGGWKGLGGDAMPEGLGAEGARDFGISIRYLPSSPSCRTAASGCSLCRGGFSRPARLGAGIGSESELGHCVVKGKDEILGVREWDGRGKDSR